MIRFLAAPLLVAAALPAAAQTGATHVDATGAIAGRSPNTIMRPIAAEPACGKTFHVPAGKLPTYGTAPLDPRCRTMQIASTEDARRTARD